MLHYKFVLFPCMLKLIKLTYCILPGSGRGKIMASREEVFQFLFNSSHKVDPADW